MFAQSLNMPRPKIGQGDSNAEFFETKYIVRCITSWNEIEVLEAVADLVLHQ